MASETHPLPRTTTLALAPRKGMAPGAPSLGRMVSDAYHAVGAQLGQVRVRAQSGSEFSKDDAVLLQTLVKTLAQLDDLERKRNLGDALAKLDDAELAELAQKGR